MSGQVDSGRRLETTGTDHQGSVLHSCRNSVNLALLRPPLIHHTQIFVFKHRSRCSLDFECDRSSKRISSERLCRWDTAAESNSFSLSLGMAEGIYISRNAKIGTVQKRSCLEVYVGGDTSNASRCPFFRGSLVRRPIIPDLCCDLPLLGQFTSWSCECRVGLLEVYVGGDDLLCGIPRSSCC
jgi:hypothetical protein